ncbi:Crp/Fnr family transcriptional regulator [Chryseobacterium nematophagum]|uniref:Crp/Fnr family transcriptional regulator n=1 Tax=Chryseobacterium nematophagum TaxID=2305228 RepID=A0A3M7TC49_9FLAO|nr:Crp/Fnr family transcriptional regulator [Chryseobacterium nematophagum]RNA60496.1 Crp/Fnr family transcriptional regulator [Chryseobacterium nematophagum]
MFINQQFFNSIGAETREYGCGEYIFHEEATSFYLFYIIKGKVKLSSFNKEGKEIIFNILFPEQCFGEALLFIDNTYPMQAVTITKCTIMRVCKRHFIKTLELYPPLYFDVCKRLSENIYSHLFMIKNISSWKAAERITGIITYLKSSQEKDSSFSFKVPLTRKQLADFTGLSVETVIRTVKILEKEGRIKIENKKILY